MEIVALFQSDDRGVRLIGRTDRRDLAMAVRQALADELRQQLEDVAEPAALRVLHPGAEQSDA